MAQPFSLEKVNWSSVTNDFKVTQQINGIGAVAAGIVSVFVVLTSSLSKESMIDFLILGFFVCVFYLVYYLTPRLFLNKKLLFLPTLFGIMTIATIMILLRDKGDVFIIFIIYDIVINAFILSDQIYALLVGTAVVALFLVHLLTAGNFLDAFTSQSLLLQVYGVASVGLIIRVFASETISLRKKEEGLHEKTKALMAQKKELFLLIDNISEGIIAVDSNRKISLINKTALKILGMIGSSKMLIGKDADKILTTVSADGHFSPISEVIEKKESVMRDDLRLVRHDKTLRLHTNTAPIIEDDGELSGTIILFRDITNESRIEEQRAEFNAIASHELRTPLTVIEGYLYYLLTDNSLKYDKKTRDFIEKSHEAANQLLRLTNDILTVVKADQNELKVALEDVDIKKLAKNLVEVLQPKAKAAKVKLIYTADDGVAKAQTDEGKIKEVISNLIENAIKFTEKGSVTVEVTSPKETEVSVRITDTGIGISKEDQKMIFHKFYRTEDWQTRKRGGTGLGLYIAKTFIERLGGKIGVESTKGKGSCFWLTLPTKPKVKRKNQKQEELNEFIKSL